MLKMENIQYFSPASSPLELLSHGAGSSKKPILGGILIAITALFLAGWLYFCFTRKLCPNFKQKGKLEGKETELRRFRLEELGKATDNFSHASLIGTGSFAKVYRGTFPVEGTLAIKKPHYETYTTREEFRNEVRLLSKVKHVNLVRLVGFCEGTGAKAAKILVYEYVTNGSLLDYIIGRGGRSLTWRDRVKIAIGAAKGIEHLHEGSIIHRDLKPSNILVGEGFEAKVSDFGLVRTGPVGDQSHVSSQIKGTPGYLDPAYCSTFHLTPFTDVYSFGVILLQLLTARPAVEYSNASRTTNSNSHIIDWARVSIEEGRIGDILDPNLLVEGCNMKMMLKMGEISLRCVVKVPKERPTMAQVCRELEAAFDSLPKRAPPYDSAASKTANNRWENRGSHSFVSIDGIGLERFHVDIDSVSFQSASLRCLETSINMD